VILLIMVDIVISVDKGRLSVEVAYITETLSPSGLLLHRVLV
jgi:hypothetical protein